jgi:hypothetical protein
MKNRLGGEGSGPFAIALGTFSQVGRCRVLENGDLISRA